MRAVWLSFKQMIRFIKYDMMLVLAVVFPFICGLLIKFGVPALERYITSYYSVQYVLTPYYGLFDVYFTFILPIMYCFIASMVILEEKDDNSAKYLAVTPLGRGGYIVSRLIIPTVISFVMTAVLLPVFKLSVLSPLTMIMLSLAGATQGLIITLIVVVLSSNKLEGFAVTKLSVIILFGIFVPYFIRSNAQYLLSFLPTYWIGKAIYQDCLIYILLSFIISAVWIAVLERMFEKKSNS